MQYLSGFFPEEHARINKEKAPHDAAEVQLPTYTIMEPQKVCNKVIGQLEETTPNGKNFKVMKVRVVRAREDFAEALKRKAAIK
ncbi:6972_t:CDS:2 [Dentiscutata erythropus]|uniref:6972_t:CDS:1 n=1 Tax=Dentiscutata erythropus TaxID=1348616 RepID=A0A9N9F2Z3_9GLOM|nr:6972_t:CDS:2 [Dentiscutata erythropus]